MAKNLLVVTDNNPVTLPPMLRTVIYYFLGVANVAYLAVLAGVSATGGNPLQNGYIVGAGAAIGGLSALFFPVAASNVQKKPEPLPEIDDDDPYEAEHAEPKPRIVQ